MSVEPIAAGRALVRGLAILKRFDRTGVGVARRLAQNNGISVSFVGFCSDCCSFAIMENRANSTISIVGAWRNWHTQRT